MKMTAFSFVVLLFSLALTQQSQELETQVFGLPIFPAPLVRQHIPLTRALGDVGSYLRNGYVLFGVELRSKDGLEPAVSIHLGPGSNLGQALDQLLRQTPDYRAEVISSHLIDIYPSGAKELPGSVLNIKVAQFDVVDAEASQILSRPKDFIPELASRLAPQNAGSAQPRGVVGDIMGGASPRITLHLRNVEVRQILNAVSEATETFPANQQPLGWMYSFRGEPSPAPGGNHSWAFLWSAPAAWKESSVTSQPQ